MSTMSSRPPPGPPKVTLPAAMLREVCQLEAGSCPGAASKGNHKQCLEDPVAGLVDDVASPVRQHRRRFVKTPYGTPVAKEIAKERTPDSGSEEVFSDGMMGGSARPRLAVGADELPPASPGFSGKEHVWFNSPLNSSHPITPYSEVYGVHPRFFIFDRGGNKVSPQVELLEMQWQAAQAAQQQQQQQQHQQQVALQLQLQAHQQHHQLHQQVAYRAYPVAASPMVRGTSLPSVAVGDYDVYRGSFAQPGGYTEAGSRVHMQQMVMPLPGGTPRPR